MSGGFDGGVAPDAGIRDSRVRAGGIRAQKYYGTVEQNVPPHTSPQAVKKRMRRLLDRRYNSCPKYAIEFRNVLSKNPYLFDPKIMTEKNCYGTVYWVLGGGSHERIIIPEVLLAYLLYFWGYKMVKTINPYAVDEKGIIAGIRAEIKYEPLKWGDVLIVKDDRPQHALLYLGKENGSDRVFEKTNGYCGEESPYGIRRLEDVLKLFVGKTFKESPFQSVDVYRRSLYARIKKHDHYD